MRFPAELSQLIKDALSGAGVLTKDDLSRVHRRLDQIEDALLELEEKEEKRAKEKKTSLAKQKTVQKTVQKKVKKKTQKKKILQKMEATLL